MDKYQEIKDLIDSLEDDFRKFYDRGNKAAGTRVRAGMQRLRELAQEVRQSVIRMNTGPR